MTKIEITFNGERLYGLSEVLAYLDKQRERISELEKENAELKKKNLDTQDAVTMQMYTNRANKEIADRQLTKAKMCLEQLVSEITVGELEVDPNVLQQAENFLKEE